jgi:hypothetical protein
MVGCQVPQKTYDDVKALKIDEQALYDFNQEFLKKIQPTTNNDDLQKRLRLTMIVQMSHDRASRGLKMLEAYLNSSEIITSSQMLLTEEMIKRIEQAIGKSTN